MKDKFYKDNAKDKRGKDFSDKLKDNFGRIFPHKDPMENRKLFRLVKGGKK